MGSMYEGEGSRLYRAPAEIIKDIYGVKEKLDRMEKMINVRSLLAEVMNEAAEADPEMWVASLRETVERAEAALGTLRELKESLDMLECELEDTLWVLGA